MDDQKYQWATPLSWLLHCIAQSKPAKARIIASRLACQMDDDTIQEIFQSEMACDGYFTPFLIQLTEEKM